VASSKKSGSWGLELSGSGKFRGKQDMKSDLASGRHMMVGGGAAI
jgi:hypothetical protein